MPKYDIPLSDIYEEDMGNRLLVTDRGKISLVARKRETPYDLISLADGEVDRLIHLLIAYRSDCIGAYEPFGVQPQPIETEQFKVDE